MCGFIGCISEKEINFNQLNEANASIICRGPDSKKNLEGSFGSFKFSLMFNRLSILDLSEIADQPMTDENKDYILMFNGEIYNHIELRNYLKKNIKFKTNHSDTEVILNGIMLEGTKFIEKLRGQFAIVFIDKRKNLVYLIRDRLGQKPLYYSLVNNKLLFGSNLISLSKMTNKTNLSEKSIYEYFKYGAIGGSDTIFSDFFKINPGEIITFSIKDNLFQKQSNLFWKVEDYVDENKFESEEFFEILNKSVEIRSNADVPIANFLSGGIDSSSIIKNMYQNSESINSFSVKFSDPNYDESIWFNKVAKRYKTNHKQVLVSSNINHNNIKESLSALDEPYYDPSVIPSFIISKEISKYYKVAISGDGGDELLGGYTRTLKSMKSSNFLKHLFSQLYNFYPSILGTGNVFLSKNNNLQTRYRSFLEDKNLINLLNFNSFENEERISLNNEFEPYKQLLIADYKFYLPDMMLYKIDRTSMANSLEVRSPFVDHKLVEYVLSSNLNYSKSEQNKSILKNYLLPDFGNEFVNRSKQGFAFDIENWIYQNIELINREIDNDTLKNLLPKNIVLKLSRNKSRINSHRIWKIYVLNYYLNQLN